LAIRQRTYKVIII